MKVIYLRGALRDLEAIRSYIAQENPDAAGKVVDRIEQAIARLDVLPLSGRPSLNGTRLLSVPGYPYVVIHRVSGATVRIVAIFHTARRRRA
ncbi:MAG: type II toxin-antitoxin system RelE/ParE family toxin [Pseudolabrys sp.]